MSRYSSRFSFCESDTQILNKLSDYYFNAVYDYLVEREKYRYKEYKGEKIFCKGKGFLVAPRYIKVDISDNKIVIEGWIKYALLPGVYIGEMSKRGGFGSATKKTLYADIEVLEGMLLNSGYANKNNV